MGTTYPPTPYGAGAPQRPQGTVYGGQGAPQGAPVSGAAAGQAYARGSAPGNPYPTGPRRRDPDQSDSLSGHLLGQQSDPSNQKSGTTKVVVILAVVLGVMVLVGLGVAVFAQDFVSDTLGGFLNDK